jgi:hypothetical protein
MELRCGQEIHQVPNDGSILGQLIPEAK